MANPAREEPDHVEPDPAPGSRMRCGESAEPVEARILIQPMRDFGGGFLTDWISAKLPDGREFGVDNGAGLGNPLLTFWVDEPGGERRYFTADLRELMQSWGEQLVAARGEPGGAAGAGGE